jgi:hypothetical protein
MRWVLLFGLAWLAVMGSFAAFVHWPAPRQGWVVTHQTSAHRTMVVTIQATRPDQASLIAPEIVEPVRIHYEEILIYVWPPGDSRGMPARRVQWTPRGGYVETTFW